MALGVPLTYHKAHAPMIAEITGMERRSNEVAKEFLRERLAAMAVGKSADLSVP